MIFKYLNAREIQQVLSNELLTSLASTLLDGTVYEIVNNLNEMQQMSERTLYNERAKLSEQYSSTKAIHTTQIKPLKKTNKQLKRSTSSTNKTT